MSYNKGVFGQGKYDSVIRVLNLLGISYAEEKLEAKYPLGMYIDCSCVCYCVDEGKCDCCKGVCGHGSMMQNLRRATITLNDHKMVIEEYLAVQTQDCDGDDEIGLAVYLEGERPELKTEFIPG